MGMLCAKAAIILADNVQARAIPNVKAVIKFCSENLTMPEVACASLSTLIRDLLNNAVHVIINARHAKLLLRAASPVKQTVRLLLPVLVKLFTSTTALLPTANLATFPVKLVRVYRPAQHVMEPLLSGPLQLRLRTVPVKIVTFKH